jgi:hypothetical protein
MAEGKLQQVRALLLSAIPVQSISAEEKERR